MIASIYERPLFYKGEKKWDDNDTLLEVYKSQRNNPQNKSYIEIHNDNGGYYIQFTVNKTIPEFNKGAKKCDLTWVDSMCFKDSTGLPGSRRSMSTFWSLAARQGQCRASKIATPVKKLLSYQALSSVDAEQKEA